jgi:antitoxin MazE
MRTTLRKIGNSQGVLIPATLRAECQLHGPVEMTVEAGRLIIEPVRTLRQGWFNGYQARKDEDAWKGLPNDADGDEWEW